MLKQLGHIYDISSHSLRVESISTHYVHIKYDKGTPNEYDKIVFLTASLTDDSLSLQEVIDNLKDLVSAAAKSLVSPDIVLKYKPRLSCPWQLQSIVYHYCEKVFFVIELPKHLFPNTMEANWFNELGLAGVKFVDEDIEHE